MDDSYASLPTSHLLGSVPAAVSEERNANNYEVPGANMQIFPPNNGRDQANGYQSPGSPSVGITPFDLSNCLAAGGCEQQPANNWRGVFSISTYTEYFNVDTDVVLNRLTSSLYPIGGNFFSKIDANPDLYGLIWISTTLVFVLASLGNCATYLMDKRTDSSTSWSFDVGYINVAALLIYGYVIVVPLAYYFLLQYLGSNARLSQFWCMWGYSLFIFVLSSFLLVIPVEFLRWIIILVAGSASASFVALNLKSYKQGNDTTAVLVASFFLQIALAFFVKVWFFS